MDALFIRPNDSKAVYGSIVYNAACEPPFWAAVMAAYCRKKGDFVGILDAEAFNMSPENVASYIKDIMPSLVVIVVTGTNLSASTWKMNGALICAQSIKNSVPDMPVLMWGLHPSALPYETIKENCVDFVMKGEGIESIHKFITNLKNKNIYDSIDGLFYKENGEVYGNERLNLIKPDDIPEPAWDMLPMKKYRAHNWQRFGSNKENERGGVCSYCHFTWLSIPVFILCCINFVWREKGQIY